MNVFLIVLSAVFSYLHMFIADNRDSWYCLVIERNLIILLLSIVLYKVTPFKHGRLKNILILNLVFWVVRIFMSTLDAILLYFNKDFQFEIMLSFGIPLIVILLYSYFILGDFNGKRRIKN